MSMRPLNPNMVRALSDAEEAVPHRGLERGLRWRDVWHSTHPCGSLGTPHSHQTIRALIDRGYLAVWGPNGVAHITEAGAAALARWREQLKETV